MGVGGDPEEIRRQARQLRRVAETVSDVSDRVARGQGLPWSGHASDRFRQRLADEGRGLVRSRETVLQAAAELDRLATVLDERQAEIRRAMKFVEDELGRARSTLQRFAGEVWDTLTGAEKAVERAARDVLRHGTNLPPVGHPDWIDAARRFGGRG
jgi:ABC-type transporter Mla subunit MlaD